MLGFTPPKKLCFNRRAQIKKGSSKWSQEVMLGLFTVVFTIFLFVFVPLKIAMGKDLDDAKKKRDIQTSPAERVA